VGDDHCIDPEIDHLSINELVFADFDILRLLGVIVSRVLFDVVVVVIAGFALYDICGMVQ
jgi:hypothetical protein